MPRDDHPGLTVVRNRHEVGAIFAHAGSVVDEDEMQSTDLPPRPRLRERLPRDLLHRLAVPALVRGPRLLESLVRGGDVLLVGRRLTPVASPGAEQAENERDEDHHADDDQDDRER